MSETSPPAEPPIDLTLVERLLAGDPPTDPADGEEQALAALFAALRAPADPSELAERERYLAVFAQRRRPVLATFLAIKSVAAGIALIAVAGTAAAAYTGSLPTSLQEVAHHGLGAPDAVATRRPSLVPTRPKTGLAPAGVVTTPTQDPGSKPAAVVPITQGLCVAFLKGEIDVKPSEYKALSKAAGGHSRIPLLCVKVLSPAGLTERPYPTVEPDDGSGKNHYGGSGSGPDGPSGNRSGHDYGRSGDRTGDRQPDRP